MLSHPMAGHNMSQYPYISFFKEACVGNARSDAEGRATRLLWWNAILFSNKNKKKENQKNQKEKDTAKQLHTTFLSLCINALVVY